MYSSCEFFWGDELWVIVCETEKTLNKYEIIYTMIALRTIPISDIVFPFVNLVGCSKVLKFSRHMHHVKTGEISQGEKIAFQYCQYLDYMFTGSDLTALDLYFQRPWIPNVSVEFYQGTVKEVYTLRYRQTSGYYRGNKQ